MGERFKANVTGEFTIFKLNGEKPNWLNFISVINIFCCCSFLSSDNEQRKKKRQKNLTVRLNPVFLVLFLCAAPLIFSVHVYSVHSYSKTTLLLHQQCKPQPCCQTPYGMGR